MRNTDVNGYTPSRWCELDCIASEVAYHLTKFAFVCLNDIASQR